ncbi:hypothetical protein TNCV_4605971 [Trichonephila clavipes]|nr:hypothetical protein TNCV_4605971 [Trichonephila clavipes]
MIVEGKETLQDEESCRLLLRFEIERGDSEQVARSSQIWMLDDNARPHSQTATQNHIAPLGWERLHHPRYSRHLTPSDLHLFPALKKNLA